jgi:hypothetical protein
VELTVQGDHLTGVLDFESTHLNYRVADFALSWRGHLPGVLKGYTDVSPLSQLDRELLLPVFWAWMFIGVKEQILGMLTGQRPFHGFEWQVRHLQSEPILDI